MRLGTRGSVVWFVPAALALSGCGGSAEALPEPEAPAVTLARIEADRRRHDPKKFIEMDLGQYFVPRAKPGERVVTYVSLQLFAVIHEQQKDALTASLASHGKRLRDAVFGVVQRLEASQFDDPRLSLLKSELLETANRVLEVRCVRDVLITDFSLQE